MAFKNSRFVILLAKSPAKRGILPVFAHSPADGPEKGDGVDVETVEQLAKEFAAQLPKEEFSPAEIFSLLLEYKHSATKALQSSQEWVVKMRKERWWRRELILGYTRSK